MNSTTLEGGHVAGGENTRFIILISLVATIGGFLFGFDSGVINGTVDGLKAAFGSDAAVTGFNVASMLLGCAIGAWFAATGRATLHTWSVVHRNDLPPFKDRTPYAAAVVDLVEGPRMMTEIVHCAHEDLRPGLELEAVFPEGVPKFRPRGGRTGS